VLNSILSQEAGRDFGDYVLLDAAGLTVRRRFGARGSVGLGFKVEKSRSVGVSASPATGSYRANPPLGAGTYRVARLELERAAGGIAVRRDLQGRLSLEAGDGPRGYGRVSAEATWRASVGGSELEARGYVGSGTDGLPAYRSFVLGGRGTLVAEPFRAYGGRSAVLAHLEWRFEAPVPALPLGSFASTGRTMIIAPFLSAGYAGRSLAGLPWGRSEGVRPVAGLALEWFMRLLRVEAGIGLRDGRFGLTVDVNRDWWGLL